MLLEEIRLQRIVLCEQTGLYFEINFYIKIPYIYIYIIMCSGIAMPIKE